MQRRPLHMVTVKIPQNAPLYAHCIGTNTTPRITITTHPTRDGQQVWYLGGQIAEEGVGKSSEEQVLIAKAELMQLFPWLDFSAALWGSFYIDRAEVKQKDNKKPDSCFVKTVGNAMIAWPTKLAFAPLLAATIIEQLPITPPAIIAPTNLLPDWPTAPIATPPWEDHEL